MRNIGAVLFLLTAVLPQGQLAQANIIHVEIGGLRNDKGQVFCALYSSPDGFPKNSEKAVARIKSAISDKQAVCEFSGMAPGTYAVSVFHDENSNGKLDTSFMGIRREVRHAKYDRCDKPYCQHPRQPFAALATAG